MRGQKSCNKLSYTGQHNNQTGHLLVFTLQEKFYHPSKVLKVINMSIGKMEKHSVVGYSFRPKKKLNPSFKPGQGVCPSLKLGLRFFF